MTDTVSNPRSARKPELESALEDRFRHAVRARGGRLIKIAPTEKGVPDRLVLLPWGRMYLVELKTVTGRVSPAQTVFHDRAAALGIEVHVLYGREQIDAWVAAYAEPPCNN